MNQQGHQLPPVYFQPSNFVEYYPFICILYHISQFFAISNFLEKKTQNFGSKNVCYHFITILSAFYIKFSKISSFLKKPYFFSLQTLFSYDFKSFCFIRILRQI